MASRNETQGGFDLLFGNELPVARHSLQRKAVIAVIALVSLSTGLCGYLTSSLARGALRQTLQNDVVSMTTTAARGVAGQYKAGRFQQLNDFLNEMLLDQRVAFVGVRDAKGSPLGRRITDPQAWQQYLEQLSEEQRHSMIQMNQPLHLSQRGAPDLIIMTRPIWLDGIVSGEREIGGYFTLALRDQAATALLNTFMVATLCVVGVICVLSVPLAAWGIRRWTAPLESILAAMGELAAGRQPQEIQLHRDDEIGVLGAGFNAMTRRLIRAKSALEQANETLESQVRRRTRQLEVANHRLRIEMRDKDDFIRAVSHDLNAPLRNIVGMTKNLLGKYEPDLDDDVTSKLQRIAANAKMETDLLNDLLELSRIKTRPGRRQVCDLDAVVRQLADSLAYDLESKGIDLQVEGPLPSVRVNRNRIRQVFQNLVDNAIKYMPADHPTRRITIGYREEERLGHLFFVRDTGAGIAEEDYQRIFQPFQRARYSGTLTSDGRGVGLSSVKTIIELYGGRIWVESKLGEGTSFHFTLGSGCFELHREQDTWDFTHDAEADFDDQTAQPSGMPSD
jgi:signal transduction histidine kinase